MDSTKVFNEIVNPQNCVCGKCYKMPTVEEQICCKTSTCLTEEQEFKDIISIIDKPMAESERQKFETDVQEQKRINTGSVVLLAGDDKPWQRKVLYNRIRDLCRIDQRIPLPSCMAWAVKTKIPDLHGIYTGFPTDGDLLDGVLKTHINFKTEIERYGDLVNILRAIQSNIEAANQTIISELHLSDKHVSAAASQWPKLGVVTYTTAFEAYIHGALSQSLDILYRFRKETLGQIGKEHLKLMMRIIIKDKNIKADKLCELLADAFVVNITGRTGDWKYLSTELVKHIKSEPNEKKFVGLIQTLAQSHKQSLLHGVDYNIPTVYHIKETLIQMMFELPKDAATRTKSELKNAIERLMEYWIAQQHWRLELSDGAYNIIVLDYKTLAQLSNLFYGIRCIFAHGNITRTLDDGGALGENNLPRSEQDISLEAAIATGVVTNVDPDAQKIKCTKYIYSVREAVRLGKDMKLDFYLCENIRTFYVYLVQVIERVCASLVYQVTGSNLQLDESKTFGGMKLDEIRAALRDPIVAGAFSPPSSTTTTPTSSQPGSSMDTLSPL